MPLNPEYLQSLQFEPRIQDYSDKDAMLYALSIGLGANPLDPRDLGYVYESDLKAWPTFANVLGHPGRWIEDPRTGVTPHMVVHGEHRLTIHAPIPGSGSIRAISRVVAVEDKGADKGAVIHLERTLSSASDGHTIATIVHSTFCRADGGFGDGFGVVPQRQLLPQRPSDGSVSTITRLDSALLYRLNVDRNPLHADPEFARRAGFTSPILHGLCTFGVASVALMRDIADLEGGRLDAFAVRFSGVVYPGEDIRIDYWHLEEGLAFQATVPQRGVTVLDNGYLKIAGAR